MAGRCWEVLLDIEKLLCDLGKFAGAIVGAKKFVEESIKSTLLDILRSAHGNTLMRIIYSFPQPDNSILKEVYSLGLDNETLHRMCGDHVTVDCLFRIIDMLQEKRLRNE